MRGFLSGARYEISTDEDAWQGVYDSVERAPRLELFYFLNEEDSFRLTLARDRSMVTEWYVSVGSTDGSHETVTRPMFERVVSVRSLDDTRGRYDKSFGEHGVAGLDSIALTTE